MLDRILIPLIGDGIPEPTLGHAAALHRAFGTRVVLLKVIDSRGHSPRLFSESMGWRLAEAEGRNLLREPAQRLHSMGIPSAIEVVSGPPAEEVLSAIVRWDADLVLLSDDHDGPGRPLTGEGLTREIISAAGASLLLIRDQKSSDAPDRGFRTVVVPLDGSSRSDWALGPAASFARTNGADLLLVHVVARPEFLHGRRSDRELEVLADRLVEVKHRKAQHYLEQKRRLFGSRNLEVRTAMAVARSIPRAIDRLASREEGSVLVLAAHGHSAGAGWSYGGVTSALLEHGSRPMLVLQDLPRRQPSQSRRTARYSRTRPAGIASRQID